MDSSDKVFPKKIDSINADIEIHETFVKKTLKKKTNAEKRERFKAECEILRVAHQSGITGIVEIIEVNMDADRPYYTMRPYAGDSNLILQKTRSNIQLAATLMAPVVRTLQTLSEQNRPIFHRDLKPENLLVDDPNADQPNLFVADFGCAFMQPDHEDRLTPDFRAVGARAFLAPEFHHGRVESVNASGDVFSLGKLLWYYVNGIELEVFPYTLWFVKEYDLRNRAPELRGVAKLNAIIAGCVHYDPTKRLSYKDLYSLLNSLIENPDLEESETFRGLALEAERRKELALAETKSVSNVLLDLFLDEMDSAMKTIGDRYGETRTIRSIQNSVPIKANNTNTIDLVVRQGTDVPIWLHQDSNFSIHARFIPARAARNYFQESTDYPFITMNLRGDNKDSKQVLQQIIWYFDSRTTLKVWTKDATTIHQERHFIEVLTGILDHCVS